MSQRARQYEEANVKDIVDELAPSAAAPAKTVLWRRSLLFVAS
jgi:hypothetical protein